MILKHFFLNWKNLSLKSQLFSTVGSFPYGNVVAKSRTPLHHGTFWFGDFKVSVYMGNGHKTNPLPPPASSISGTRAWALRSACALYCVNCPADQLTELELWAQLQPGQMEKTFPLMDRLSQDGSESRKSVLKRNLKPNPTSGASWHFLLLNLCGWGMW